MSKPSTHINPPLKLPFSSNSNLKISIRIHPLLSSSKPKWPPLVQSTQSPESPQTQPTEEHTPKLISILRAIPDWTDTVKEGGMKKKRELYTHEKWVEHRSSLRHVRHLLSSRSSRVIVSLITPVTFFTSVAIVIASYNSAVALEWLPEFFPLLRASSLPYQLTAPALALLLVFRTEASYSRFLEARKAWTTIVSGINDLARQVIASVDDGDGSGNFSIKSALLQYIMAFPYALKCHLIYESDVRHDLQDLLEKDDLSVVLSSNHRPRCVIEFISQSLQVLNMEESKRSVLEAKISALHEGIGICEQLEGIPIPLSYTRLTSRFLFLWHITLPVILWDDCHWIVVPATFISAAALFCIEEVGVLIEEPFPMLALDELCEVAKSGIQEAMSMEKLIRARVKSKRHTLSIAKHSSNGRPRT